MRFIPSSLLTRTSLLLIAGLAIIEATGLGIHALDGFYMAKREQIHEYQFRLFSIYRTVAEAAPDTRQDALNDLVIPPEITAFLSNKPDDDIKSAPISPSFFHPDHFMMEHAHPFHPFDFPGHFPPFMGPPPPPFPEQNCHLTSLLMPPELQVFNPCFMPPPPLPEKYSPVFKHSPYLHPTPFNHFLPFPLRSLLPSHLYPQTIWAGQILRTYSTSLLLPDGKVWLIVRYTMPFPNPFSSPTFMVAFLVMAICGSALIVWAVRRLITPVTTLANAVETLGKDIHNSVTLPENGASEIKRAAIAFNTMVTRVRRIIRDRTIMLTAIGHDLRTPITRLKLRAEFINDDELRNKILADLDEMEAMVASTLVFGRENSSHETPTTFDLCVLLQTIVDETIESHPEQENKLLFQAPSNPIFIQTRSIALKRALNNLILNALKYAGNAAISVIIPPHPQDKTSPIQVIIEDNGPGLPEEALERVFEPFVRIETSRNRETGGTGLGLSITQSIIQAQGGNITLQNRPQGGLKAIITIAQSIRR
ncbi:ATP-binding protein [Swingsia samuiensis]|uniref:histidine kinase n=1 Tax=Swingsia samuiensis TaxID=1293412 RepID=A0A4Y6UIZ7_9PROT|nr:ATP-binding protein [Swingsia samuiensis]QDH16598.1 HAMP domain-containing protein [Swingsia samuiensis]